MSPEPYTPAAYVAQSGLVAALNRIQAIVKFDLYGHILDANERFLDTMGYELSEILGHHHSVFCTEGYAQTPAYQSFWARLRGGFSQHGEYYRLGKGGQGVWLQASYNPVRGIDGAFDHIVKFATDITAFKRQSMENAAFLHALDKVQAVIEFDLNGTVLNANAKFLDTFGYRLDDIKGKHHRLFCAPDYAQSEAYQALWGRLRQGQHDSGEYPRVTRSGDTVWLQSSYNPILDLDGKPYKVVKFATDISARKAQERLLQQAQAVAEDALQSKNMFLGTVSHELRTPLNAILGFGDHLRASPGLNDDQRAMVSDIVGSGRHLLTLVNDLLDIVKANADDIAVAMQAVPLDDALSAAVGLLQPQAHARGIALMLDPVPPGLQVWADPTRLRQVLLNLLSNAVKYNRPQGQVHLRASASGTRVRLEVQDTGHGIPPEQADHVFQPFQRLGAERGDVEGTGIGLNITQKIVQRMSGRIGFTSTPGEGSVFWVELETAHVPTLALPPSPVSPDDAAPAPEPVLDTTDATRTRRAAHRLLVAEDNPTNQNVLARQLERLGYPFDMTADGQAALAQWPQHPYAAVLTDLQMPRMGGQALCAALRQRGVAVPLVLLSANAVELHTPDWAPLNIGAALLKPTDLPWLATTLDRLCLAPSQADLPVLDLAPLHALVGDDPDALADFLNDFADTAAELVARIGPDAPRSDMAAAAHQLKSSARAVGAMALGHACDALETACSGAADASIDALPRRIAQVQAAWQRLGLDKTSSLAYISAFLASPRPPCD